MSQTRDQKRFTISEVAADWHELMIPQRTMRPSIASVNEQLDPRFAASRHTTAPISHIRPSPRVEGRPECANDSYRFPFPPHSHEVIYIPIPTCEAVGYSNNS